MATVNDKIWLPIKPKQKTEAPIWTGRADVLNSQPNYDTTQKRQVGLFHISRLASVEGFSASVQRGLMYLTNLIKEAEAEIHHRPVWKIAEDFLIFVSEMVGLLAFVIDYLPELEYRSYARDGVDEVRILYRRYRFGYCIYKSLLVDGSPEKPFEKFIAKQLIKQYENSGFQSADEDHQENVIDLHSRLDQLMQRYRENLYSESSNVFSSQLGLKVCSATIGESTIATDSFVYASHHSIRQADFMNYYVYDEKQEAIFLEILEIRSQLAKLSNFDSYFGKAAAETPLPSTKNVAVFIRYLSEHLEDLAQKEYSMMSSLKDNIDPGSSFCIWDVDYVISFARKEISCELKDFIPSYLTLGAFIEGINKVFAEIFFIQFEISNVLADEVYCPDMYKLQVIHVTFGIICYIFLDLMQRPGKPTKTTHYVLRQGKFEENDEYISKIKWRPIRVVLVMSIEAMEYPACLSIDEAESLFTELGKVIPSLLYHQRHQYMVRYLGCIDYNTVLAKLMKRLFYDPRIMTLMFKTYPEGNKLSDEQLRKIYLSRKAFVVHEYKMMVFKAAIDQEVYSRYPLKHKLIEVFKKQEKFHLFFPAPNDCCTHLKETYMIDEETSGKYYNEIIDEVVVISLWKRFFSEDPLNPQSSDAFAQLLIDCFFITEPEQCYNKLLGWDVDLLKIAKVFVDEAKDSFNETLELLEQLVADTVPVVEEESVDEDTPYWLA